MSTVLLLNPGPQLPYKRGPQVACCACGKLHAYRPYTGSRQLCVTCKVVELSKTQPRRPEVCYRRFESERDALERDMHEQGYQLVATLPSGTPGVYEFLFHLAQAVQS